MWIGKTEQIHRFSPVLPPVFHAKFSTFPQKNCGKLKILLVSLDLFYDFLDIAVGFYHSFNVCVDSVAGCNYRAVIS